MKDFLFSHISKQTSAKKPFQTTWTVFWAAFLVRVLYITLAHTYRFRLDGDHFQFGWEAGRIARALVTGHGYADPFFGHTGPTTWVAPLYPLMMAAVFKVFGIYTLRSAWVILAINSVFSALTARTTYEIGARCFNHKIAIWSAWIWALYPAAMQYAVRWVWEMTLSTWLFTWILVLALRMRGIGESSGTTPATESTIKDQRTLSRWLLFGFLWGMLALSNPSPLLFLPAAGLWVIRGKGWRTENTRRQLLFACASAGIFLLCISPWMMRNAAVFHRFIPIRANLGAEFALGNGPGANGFLMEYDHPYESPKQLHLYTEMGEVAYAESRGRTAWEYVRRNPKVFLSNSVKRLYFFWISVPHPSDRFWYIEPARVASFAFASIAGLLGLALALKRHIPAAWLFAWAFLLIPMIYYFVTVHARFRHPLEPLIAILTTYLFQSTETKHSEWNLRTRTVDAQG